VTNEKAYLCRRRQFALSADFVLRSMLAQMKDRGLGNLCIARTDDTPSYGAFYLRPKLASETDDFYGTEIYGQFYRINDHSELWAQGERRTGRTEDHRASSARLGIQGAGYQRS